jgi:hypothetical protein
MPGRFSGPKTESQSRFSRTAHLWRAFSMLPSLAIVAFYNRRVLGASRGMIRSTSRPSPLSDFALSSLCSRCNRPILLVEWGET